MQKISKSSFPRRTKSLLWWINSGRTSCLKHSNARLSMTAAPAKNFYASFRKTTKNCKKYRRRWKTTYRLKERPSPVFIFFPMISCCKFCLKLEILTLSRLICANVSTISTGFSLLMLSNLEKSYQ